MSTADTYDAIARRFGLDPDGDNTAEAMLARVDDGLLADRFFAHLDAAGRVTSATLAEAASRARAGTAAFHAVPAALASDEEMARWPSRRMWSRLSPGLRARLEARAAADLAAYRAQRAAKGTP